MKKLLCALIVLSMLCSLLTVFAESTPGQSYFDPVLANAIKNTTSEWYSTGYNRALLTILLAFNVASDDVMGDLNVLTGMLSNDSYVGMPDGYTTILVGGYVDDYCLLIGYTPTQKTAYYLTVKGNGITSELVEALIAGSCSEYYKNTKVDMADAFAYLRDLAE